MFFNRKKTIRTWWLKTGIYISAAYMIFTIGNKLYVDSVFKKSFEKAGIKYQRFSAQPTIFNNILWYAVAETETQYHLAFYSLLDTSSIAKEIMTIDKQRDLLDMHNTELETLTWFSNEYYNVSKKEKKASYKYVDLRYPMMNPKDPNSSVFNFTIFNKDNQWDILPFDGNPPNEKDLAMFIKRIKGI
jgi:inner membrane protein